MILAMMLFFFVEFVGSLLCAQTLFWYSGLQSFSKILNQRMMMIASKYCYLMLNILLARFLRSWGEITIIIIIKIHCYWLLFCLVIILIINQSFFKITFYLPYSPVYKSIPCISRPPNLEPKNKFFLFLCKNFLEKLFHEKNHRKLGR